MRSTTLRTTHSPTPLGYASALFGVMFLFAMSSSVQAQEVPQIPEHSELPEVAGFLGDTLFVAQTDKYAVYVREQLVPGGGMATLYNYAIVNGSPRTVLSGMVNEYDIIDILEEAYQNMGWHYVIVVFHEDDRYENVMFDARQEYLGFLNLSEESAEDSFMRHRVSIGDETVFQNHRSDCDISQAVGMGGIWHGSKIGITDLTRRLERLYSDLEFYMDERRIGCFNIELDTREGKDAVFAILRNEYGIHVDEEVIGVTRYTIR